MRQSHIESGGRYPVLRTIAILWLVGAAITLVAGVYQAVIALIGAGGYSVIAGKYALVAQSDAHWGGRVSACIIWLAITFFTVIFNVAVAELIKLAIDVEHNTRMTSMNTAAIAFPPAGAAAAPSVPRHDARRRLAEETAEAALIRGH